MCSDAQASPTPRKRRSRLRSRSSPGSRLSTTSAPWPRWQRSASQGRARRGPRRCAGGDVVWWSAKSFSRPRQRIDGRRCICDNARMPKHSKKNSAEKAARKTTSDLRTMNFLRKRSCLIVVTANGEHNVGTYLQDEGLTILGRGTGLFLECEGQVFVATNYHVIQAHKFREVYGTTIHISIGEKFAEVHSGYVFAEREFLDDGNGHAKIDAKNHPIPKDPVNDTDLALVRLNPDVATAAREAGLKFVRWPSSSDVTPSPATQVCFCGFPLNNVDFLKELRKFYAEGYSLFTTLIRVEGKRLVIDANESAVCYGVGDVDPQRDLHGISGAGLFDMRGRLLGIVYGGDPDLKEIYACNMSALGALFDALK